MTDMVAAAHQQLGCPFCLALQVPAEAKPEKARKRWRIVVGEKKTMAFLGLKKYNDIYIYIYIYVSISRVLGSQGRAW